MMNVAHLTDIEELMAQVVACLAFGNHAFGLVCPSYTPLAKHNKTNDLSLLHHFVERQDLEASMDITHQLLPFLQYDTLTPLGD